MSMPQEAAKVASGIVDTLKNQPLALALIVINVLFIAFVGFVIHGLADAEIRKDNLLADLARNCVVVQKGKANE